MSTVSADRKTQSTRIAKRPVIFTERLILEVCTENDAELVLKFYVDNLDHLSRWEPERSAEFYTIEHWQKTLQENRLLLLEGSAVKFVVFNKERTKVVGTCNFNNITRGVFQACHLGYAIAGRYQGQGYMYEAAKAGIEFMFNDMGMHRVMANYMPANERSGVLLERLGFEKEGYARDYLKIAGEWEDHVLTALINPQPM
ncbi:ribosomal protein S5-alanine N-acetyltransferase [Parendozoicomonas sp. Alg238-R29]|uniref:ribosomal protein S5-alanine N-acetyltransferase n=1 Tax=Parendozoicomonas sp. Alg238-R29 TaxID=2993446 RepID=UPI00248E7429|nr:ribosomal protein S5-alanine N-acetyltransferase [Parendozoicomonas sp. Alg238-R29]